MDGPHGFCARHIASAARGPLRAGPLRARLCGAPLRAADAPRPSARGARGPAQRAAQTGAGAGRSLRAVPALRDAPRGMVET